MQLSPYSRRVLSLLLWPAEEHVHLELDEVKAAWIFQYSPPSPATTVCVLSLVSDEGGNSLERRRDAACKVFPSLLEPVEGGFRDDSSCCDHLIPTTLCAGLTLDSINVGKHIPCKSLVCVIRKSSSLFYRLEEYLS